MGGEQTEEGLRICDKCKKLMLEGFIIDGGEEYYCSEECLHSKYTKEEWLKMYAEGNSESLYTEWDLSEVIDNIMDNITEDSNLCLIRGILTKHYETLVYGEPKNG